MTEVMKNTTLKTYADLVAAISAILPKASFTEDNEGQLLINTNLTLLVNDEVVDMDADPEHG